METGVQVQDMPQRQWQASQVDGNEEKEDVDVNINMAIREIANFKLTIKLPTIQLKFT